MKLLVAHPVGADVAGIADRQDVDIRRIAEDIDDLKGGRLLPLKAERIDGIDDGDGYWL